MNKAFYIPTTTLNFNNILSSESISPKSFYDKRDFGYSRWFSVDENCEENTITLYDSPYLFSRPESDIEDHPLLVKVILSEDVYSLFKHLSANAFSYNKTIYLTPWNTQFIFFSEKDKLTTLSISESSLETKLVRLYQKRFIVNTLSQVYDVTPLEVDTNNANILEIDTDIRTNKMKGLLYGYYIGALLSTTRDNVKKLNVLREINNIFAAVLSSSDNQPTAYQIESIEVLFTKLKELNPFYSGLRDIIKDNATYDAVLLYLERNGISKDKINKRDLLYELTRKQRNEDSPNPATVWINNAISDMENYISHNRNRLSPDDGEVIVRDNNLVVINTNLILTEVEKNLFTTWVNDILSSKEYSGKINVFREKLSDELTKQAKAIYQTDWDNCHAKVFLNKLRRHIRGEEFDERWDNGLLSSIAAVITNGTEWNNLLLFMQNKGVNDYRIAFALYGVLNGYANLTRDFTDLIYDCDSKYVSEVYKEFHGQLFGVSPEIAQSFECATDQTLLYDKVRVFGDYNKLKLELEGAKIVKRKYQGLSIPQIYSNIIDKLEKANGYWDSAFDAMIKDKTDGITQATIDAICLALDLDCWKPSKTSKKSTSADNSVNYLLFSSEEICVSEFYLDDAAFSKIESILSSDSHKQLIEENINYIQKSYRKGGKNANAGKSTNNKDVIYHLEQLLWSKRSGKNMYKKTDDYNSIPLDDIINKLKSIYP